MIDGKHELKPSDRNGEVLGRAAVESPSNRKSVLHNRPAGRHPGAIPFKDPAAFFLRTGRMPGPSVWSSISELVC